MHRKFSILAALALTVCSSQAAIDFTPLVEEYTSQGIVYRKVSFKEESGPISFVPPRGWNVRGGKDLLQLEPPNKNFVEATISATPLSGPVLLDESTVEALKEQLLRGAPATSQAVQIVRCEPNPVPMAPYPSVEIVISYHALGRTFEKSMIFVQAVDTQLIFRLTAPKEDFDPLNQLFRSSIGSWQWRLPKPGGAMTALK
jgi:hypothetical protein